MELALNVSVSCAGRFQFVGTVEQSVPIVDISGRRTRWCSQTRMLGFDRDPDVSSLDPWEFGRLAIRLSLRDDPAALDICHFAREWQKTRLAGRMDALRAFVHRECLRDMAVSLDRSSEAVNGKRELMIMLL